MGYIHSTTLLILLASIWSLVAEVAAFWKSRLRANWHHKSPKEELLEQLDKAQSFEEWEVIAYDLDSVLGNDLWRQNPVSPDYDYRLIYQRLQGLILAREENDVLGLASIIRSGLLRNLGNISHKNLFNRAYAGSKLLIEDYIDEVVHALEHIGSLPPSPHMSAQAKLDFLHDTRQCYGCSTLILQGGAIFGLCHLGVVKALHRHGLLPRIITGTAVGALIASLVAIHTDEELPKFLSREGIDLSAFDEREKKNSWRRKLTRFLKYGYFLDIKVLEKCVRANVGDLTFDEAYQRTRRILNITVSSTSRYEVPTLLNYLTAPNVLIWSAACASNATKGMYSDVTLMCKDETGNIVPWGSSSGPIGTSTAKASKGITWTPYTQATYRERDSPFDKIAELFNVNHFIVSQARPYLAPFLTSDLHHHQRGPTVLKLKHLLLLEIHHMLSQFSLLLSLLPSRRKGNAPPLTSYFPLNLLLDPATLIPSITNSNFGRTSITIVPNLTLTDFEQLIIKNPDKETLDYWIRKGERSIWPALGVIRARCRVEFTLDTLYQGVRGVGLGSGVYSRDGMDRRAEMDGGKGGERCVGSVSAASTDRVVDPQFQSRLHNPTSMRRRKRRQSR